MFPGVRPGIAVFLQDLGPEESISQPEMFTFRSLPHIRMHVRPEVEQGTVIVIIIMAPA